jgi:hypothetical protein
MYGSEPTYALQWDQGVALQKLRFVASSGLRVDAHTTVFQEICPRRILFELVTPMSLWRGLVARMPCGVVVTIHHAECARRQNYGELQSTPYLAGSVQMMSLYKYMPPLSLFSTIHHRSNTYNPEPVTTKLLMRAGLLLLNPQHQHFAVLGSIHTTISVSIRLLGSTTEPPIQSTYDLRRPPSSSARN